MPSATPLYLAKSLDFVGKTTFAGTAADRTFSPAGRNAEGVMRYESRAEGIPAGFPAITVSSRRPTASSKLYKTVMQLHMPTLEVLGVADSGYQAANAKAYEHMARLEVMCPERGTPTQRADFYSYLASMFLTTITASDGDPTGATNSFLRALIVDLDTVYG